MEIITKIVKKSRNFGHNFPIYMDKICSKAYIYTFVKLKFFTNTDSFVNYFVVAN